MSGKHQGKEIVFISFSLAIGMVVRKVVDLIVVSKCELYYLALWNSKYMWITYWLGFTFYWLGFIFFTSFCKYVTSGSDKNWVFLSISQGIVGEFWFTYWLWTLTKQGGAYSFSESLPSSPKITPRLLGFLFCNLSKSFSCREDPGHGIYVHFYQIP